MTSKTALLKIAFHPIYKHPLPAGHKFPMDKYDLLPRQLLHEGTCTTDHFFQPHIQIEDEQYIRTAHDATYVDRLYHIDIHGHEARKIGFPLSEKLVERERTIANGTIQSCDFALENGLAMNIAGGTHHAYSNRGEAFCMLNDQAIGAHYLLAHQKAEKILIIDLDVHQGNGTAKIFQNEERVFTFSMHGKSNYPFKKETSDLDIALPDNTTDQAYLNILKDQLPQLIQQVKPDFVFYLSGVDILSTDKLGKLGCTIEGCKERDRFVLSLLHQHQLPVEISMGGGYSKDIKIIIEAHANTYRMAQDIYY